MDYSFYTKSQYFTHLTQDIARTKRGDRVLVATMSFITSNQLLDTLYFEMRQAALRGVKVTLLVDAFAFLASDEKPHEKALGPLLYRRSLSTKLPQPFADRYRVLKQLEECGCTVTITNLPKRPLMFLAAGRSHIKAAVINDKLYIGGCNLTDPAQLDMMVSWHDQTAADWVYGNLTEVAHVGTTQATFKGQDQILELGGHAKLIIDAGKPKQSTILAEAYKLIDEAEEQISLTCQFFPGGETAKHLKMAYDRGVKVDVFYSHPSVHGIYEPVHHLYAFKERARLPQALFTNRLLKGRPKLHTKLLCTDKGAMIGSHNYVVQGVRFGTAEIALLNRDPTFAADMWEHFQELLS